MTHPCVWGSSCKTALQSVCRDANQYCIIILIIIKTKHKKQVITYTCEHFTLTCSLLQFCTPDKIDVLRKEIAMIMTTRALTTYLPHNQHFVITGKARMQEVALMMSLVQKAMAVSKWHFSDIFEFIYADSSMPLVFCSLYFKIYLG